MIVKRSGTASILILVGIVHCADATSVDVTLLLDLSVL